MELGTILAYAKERNLVGKESTFSRETRERRKPDISELKPFIDGLSNKDSRVRVNALTNLSSLVFNTVIETEEKLLLTLVKVLRDSDANVRKSALRLYELLNYHASFSHKTKYNKKILPLAIEIASRDDNMEVRKQALSALVMTGDKRVVKIMVQMINGLSEDEYKTVFTDNLWSVLVNGGLGPKFRRELFKEFVSNTNEDARRRIEEITQGRYLG
jgi:HEAT repeat protein